MTSPDQNYTSWHCGMKVVFVGWPDNVMITAGADRYCLGEVYKIEGLRAYSAGDMISFQGGRGKIKRDAVYIRVSACWALAEAFRPVQTRKTDISCFTAMLSPKPAKAKKVRA